MFVFEPAAGDGLQAFGHAIEKQVVYRSAGLIGIGTEHAHDSSPRAARALGLAGDAMVAPSSSRSDQALGGKLTDGLPKRGAAHMELTADVEFAREFARPSGCGDALAEKSGDLVGKETALERHSGVTLRFDGDGGGDTNAVRSSPGRPRQQAHSGMSDENTYQEAL